MDKEYNFLKIIKWKFLNNKICQNLKKIKKPNLNNYRLKYNRKIK